MKNTIYTTSDINIEGITPKVSKEFLDHIKDVFDIRKIIMGDKTVDYLKGIQDVLNYIEFNNYKEDD